MELEGIGLEAREGRGKENKRLLLPRQEGMEGSSVVTIGNVASSNTGLEARRQWSQAFETLRGKDFHFEFHTRDFPGGPVVENPPSNAGDMGSIPRRGTKIPHATGQLSPLTTTAEPTCSGARAPQQKIPHATRKTQHSHK